NAPLVRFPGKVAYYCTNDTGCPAQTKQRIEHFVSREAMNVLGVGKDMVDILYDEGLIHDAADLYDLRLKDLWGDDSRRNKINTAQTIIKGINDSKTTPFPQLVYALGIRFVGEVAAKTLAQHFQSMDNLMAATEEDLLKIDGIGTAVASSVVNYFKNDDNKQLIERLRSHGLRFSLTAEELAERTGKLKDKTFLISGTFRLHTRNEYRQIIEQHGGKNMENVSRFTSYLLVGDEPGPVKLKKAAQLGIPVITEEQFRDMLQLPEGAFGQGVDNPDKPVRKPKQAKTEDNMHEERTLFDA
ncbi:MAG: helix-hairpin-helix domain-containing protein, partial [Prevotella sp.]|nr:helix-hairpin-helix domain-containing protein [Prevotella sp.]